MVCGGFRLEVCDPAAECVAELVDCGCAVTYGAKVQDTEKEREIHTKFSENRTIALSEKNTYRRQDRTVESWILIGALIDSMSTLGCLCWIKTSSISYISVRQDALNLHKEYHIDQVQRRDSDEVEKAILNENIHQPRGRTVPLDAQSSPES